MGRWIVVGVTSLAVLVVIALAGPADGLVVEGHFSDDNGTLFEIDIDAIAEAGITKGCNPPSNTNYCPDRDVDRGAMAAFLRRALNLPSTTTDHFIDDDNSIFHADINAIAEAGITKGCNPPTNNRYCPGDTVDRGAMAAFLRRALNLPAIVLSIPMSDHSALRCDKDGKRCTLTADVVSGRNYRIEEGVFQVQPASDNEMDDFNSANTHFTLTLDGSSTVLTALPVSGEDDVTIRRWRANLSFSSGDHTLVGRWRWDDDLIHTVTVTVRADG
ncbi:MAG: hypothetical protein V3S26_08925 [Acidimicrobiia bacterium]